jgi:phosphoribosyl 1,2-cyclic phosphodiesterase
MPFHFTVLASGSSGNACFLEVAGHGHLLDIGLGPRLIAQRLAVHGATWNCIHSVVLTHTHADHWKEATLRHLCRRRIPIYCHRDHHDALASGGRAFEQMKKSSLINGYETDKEFFLSPELSCRPIALSHDSVTTFGFRFEAQTGAAGIRHTLAYAADLGCWDDSVAHALSGADLLALEFNHDVGLEYASGRPAQLIARILGERGHLSNNQAAALVTEIFQRGGGKRLLHLVLLHLSRECNKPDLAATMAQTLANQFAPHLHVHTARQDLPSPRFTLGQPTPPVFAPRARLNRMRTHRASSAAESYLPGMEPW